MKWEDMNWRDVLAALSKGQRDIPHGVLVTTATSAQQEIERDQSEHERDQSAHVWVDGPDGPGYHCARCEISKCDDHNLYRTCASWMLRAHKREVAQLRTALEAVIPFFMPEVSRGPAHDDWLDAAEAYLATSPTGDAVEGICQLHAIARNPSQVVCEITEALHRMDTRLKDAMITMRARREKSKADD